MKNNAGKLPATPFRGGIDARALQTDVREIVPLAVDCIAKRWGGGQSSFANRLIGAA